MSAQDDNTTATTTEPVEMAAGDLAQPPEIEAAAAPALPAWLIDADAEETRELEALGVVIDPQFTEDAQRDALISKLLRAHHEHDTDVSRYDDAEKLEHEQITQRYNRLRAPAQRQLMRISAFILHLINTVTFTGKNKSRHVGWGSYGRRKQPDKVELANMLEVVSALRTIEPQAVTVAVTINADVQKKADDILSTFIVGTGQLPLDGAAVSALSDLRAAIRGGAQTVGKAEVGRLLKVTKANEAGQQVPVHTIPGAAIVPGADKSWFEVEPPAHG